MARGGYIIKEIIEDQAIIVVEMGLDGSTHRIYAAGAVGSTDGLTRYLSDYVRAYEAGKLVEEAHQPARGVLSLVGKQKRVRRSA